MKKLPIILSIISTILSILSVILTFAALNWIHINNQREVATELLLSAKIKCLETKNEKDCDLAKEYLKDSKDRAIKFDF